MEIRQRVKGRRAPEQPPQVLPPSGNGTLLEPEFDEERFGDYCTALSVDFLVKNFPEERLRPFTRMLQETLERCQKRLQHLESTRNALLCSHCQKPLPGGRFAGEIVIRDELTGELQALRACCEACYREVSRIANERRAKQQGSIRGTIAF